MKTIPKFCKQLYLALGILLLLFNIGYLNKADADPVYTVSINNSSTVNNTVLIGNVNYIPLKTGFEQLGYHVEWSQADRSLYIISPDKSIVVNNVTKQIKMDGLYSALKKEILNKNGTTYITARYLSQLTDSQIKVNGKLVNISNTNIPIFGENADGSFWLKNNGNFYSLKSKTPKLIGKVDLPSNNAKYSSMSINSIKEKKSFVITIKTFSGEPLKNVSTIKIFIKNDEVIYSMINGSEENLETSKNGANWVFNNGHLVNLINDNGDIVKNYDLTKIIEDDFFSIDGFIGEEFMLVRSETKKQLWAINMKTNKSVRLYNKLLSKEEQASIEGNTDIGDIHYGDNLHFKSRSGDTLNFNYFSYLQGAKDMNIEVKLSEFRNFFSN